MLSDHKPEKENRSPSPKKMQQRKPGLKVPNEILNSGRAQLLVSNQEQENILEDVKYTALGETKQIAILRAKLADK